jgi:hypothetical protein
MASDPKNQCRGSGFAVPINLVGGHRFSHAKPIDPDLLVAILQAESALRPEDKRESSAGSTAQSVIGHRPSKWEPSPNIDPDLVPPIPDFLKRKPADEPEMKVLVIVSDKLKARAVS